MEGGGREGGGRRGYGGTDAVAGVGGGGRGVVGETGAGAYAGFRGGRRRHSEWSELLSSRRRTRVYSRLIVAACRNVLGQRLQSLRRGEA